MKVRDFYFAKAQSLPDSGVYTLPIPPGLKLQHLRVIIGATNGATSNTVGKLCGMVTKVEVVNGSDVIQSMSGRENQAFFAFNSTQVPGFGKLPAKTLTSGAGSVVSEEFPVLFGRYYLDPFYYLDTSRYQNCQLRVTYALTISATAGFATTTGTISVIGRIIDADAPTYQGFIMAKEVQSLTTAASGDDITILPLDWPYAEIMVQALKTTVAPETIFTNFKLLVNAGQYIPFDMTSTDFLTHNQQMFGRFSESWVPLSDTTATWLSDLYSRTGANFDIAGATGKGNVSSATAESIVVTFTTGQAAGTMSVNVQGLAPHACFMLPMGTGNDPADYLSVSGVSDLRLVKTQGVSAAAAAVVIAQLRQ